MWFQLALSSIFSLICFSLCCVFAVIQMYFSLLFLSSRMIEIQTQMSERAVELLNLPEGQPCFLLDVG